MMKSIDDLRKKYTYRGNRTRAGGRDIKALLDLVEALDTALDSAQHAMYEASVPTTVAATRKAAWSEFERKVK